MLFASSYCSQQHSPGKHQLPCAHSSRCGWRTPLCPQVPVPSLPVIRREELGQGEQLLLRIVFPPKTSPHPFPCAATMCNMQKQVLGWFVLRCFTSRAEFPLLPEVTQDGSVEQLESCTEVCSLYSETYNVDV